MELHNGNYENVLHVPNISMNLLSIYQITQKGKKVEFTSDSVSVIDIHALKNLGHFATLCCGYCDES